MFSAFAISIVTLLFLQTVEIKAGNGYHYDRPKSPAFTGHYFAPISTISPLPAVPDLPPLPTARPKVQAHSQSLVQVHPPPPPSPQKSIASAYLPPSAFSVPQQTYIPVSQPVRTQAYAPSVYEQQQQQQYQTDAAPVFGQRIANPSYQQGPTLPPQNFGQQLRLPFGQGGIINYPTTAADSEFYVVNGRQLKQYHVLEYIDNDIEQNIQPFLSQQFFMNSRSDIGASGTGATLPLPGLQVDSRASALVREQQRFAQQRGSPSSSNAIALGSGSLGYIRDPNGNVYLGSGSLGYVSGQERSQALIESRTRSETTMPGALHFGHGALGGRSLFFGFK